MICGVPVTPDMLALCEELGETIAEGINARVILRPFKGSSD